MKILNFIILIILFAFIYSCGPAVTFNEPQPSGEKNLASLPRKLHGKYLNNSDSSILVIDGKSIQKITNFNIKIHKSSLDSTFSLMGDTVINLKTKISERVKRDGDSLIWHNQMVDTIFNINKDVVRKYKGYYFLNKLFVEGVWEVRKLELTKGKIILSSISATEDLKALNTKVETAQDSVAPNKLSPSEKQFKEFVKNDGFGSSEVFIKQK